MSAAWALLGMLVQTPEAAPQLVAGPMVGHVAPDHARIWVQGDGPGWYTVEVREGGAAEWRRPGGYLGRGGRPSLDRQRGNTAVIEVGGLQPATRYEYRLVNAAGPLPAESEQAFRTPPPHGVAEDFTVAFGSCAGDWGPDPSQPVFRAVDARHPDVFLWLGDNVYYTREAAEWEDPAKMWARWQRQRALPNLQPLLRRSAHYAVWDDHDFGPDDTDRLFPLRDVALSVFSSYWANPGYGSEGSPGVWHRFQRGRVEFFLLDTRYHRDPDWMEPGPHKSMLGAAQWRWLAEGLAHSRADFKLIVSATQVLARYHRYESWDLFPADRARLLQLIGEQQIGGVVFLSGDRHIGEVLRWTPPEAPYPLYEFTSSPLAAGLHEPVADEQAGDRVPGSLVQAEHFAWLEFRFPEGESPLLRYTPYGVNGSALQPSTELRLTELQPAATAPR